MESNSFYSRIRFLLFPYEKRIKISIAWIFVFQALTLVEPFIFATILDDLVHGGKSEIIMQKLFAAFIILFVIMFVKKAKDKNIREVGNAIDAELNPALLKKMLSLPLSFHERENSGRLIGKVIRGINKLIDGVYMALHDFFPILGQALTALAILMYIDYRSACIVLSTMCALGIIRIRFTRKTQKTRKERHDLGQDITAHESQCLENILTTQSFAQEKREHAHNIKECTRFQSLINYEHEMSEAADAWCNTILNFSRITVIGFTAYAMWNHVFGVGTMAFVVSMSERLFASCYRIGGIYTRATECIEPVSTLTEILLEKNPIQDPTFDIDTVPRDQENKQDILITNLRFRYPKQQVGEGLAHDLFIPILTIENGKTLGIVGHTGSGKSTLVKLLMRFYDPQNGSIRVNGVDLRDMKLESVRRRIGYVPQEVELYDLTIAENIAYGNPQATREEIIAAATSADAHTFIQKCENGYDALVGNKGMRLSGGQRQKIGIARAMLLAPPVLIFDEATSSVDSFSEREIQKTMETVSRGRTAIIIAHRLSTVRRADRILVMDSGKIIESGTHEDLMRKNGVYADLIRAQERSEVPAPITDPRRLN